MVVEVGAHAASAREPSGGAITAEVGRGRADQDGPVVGLASKVELPTGGTSER